MAMLNRFFKTILVRLKGKEGNSVLDYCVIALITVVLAGILLAAFRNILNGSIIPLLTNEIQKLFTTP